MKAIVGLVAGVAALCSVASSAAAASVYDADLAEAAANLRALMAQVDQMPASQRSSAYAVRADLLELSKRLHRMEEEALSIDLALKQRGAPASRQLAYVAAISDELDMAQSMTGKFLDTGDRVFWTAALQAATTAREMMAGGL